MALLAMVVSACGAPAEVPELTATALPEDRADAAASPAAGPSPAPSSPRPGSATPDGGEAAGHASTGAAERTPSRDSAMAARLEEHVAAARSADHLSADVTGDGIDDLLVAAVGTDAVFSVTLATWDGAGYTDRGRITATTPERVGTPALRDLDGDGRAEVLVAFTSGSGPGVVVAAVTDEANLVVPTRCPLGAPAEHRLRLPAGKTATVRFVCGVTEDPGGDAAATLLHWDGGHFRAPETGDAAEDRDRDEKPGREAKPGREEKPGREAKPGRDEKPGGPGVGDDPPGKGRGPDGDGPPGRGGRG